MPLLDITVSKRHDYLCSLEESTARKTDLYAHFVKVPADEVVNHALEYVFGKDKDFVQFLEESKNAEVPPSLRAAGDVSEDPGESKTRRKQGAHSSK